MPSKLIEFRENVLWTLLTWNHNIGNKKYPKYFHKIHEFIEDT